MGFIEEGGCFLRANVYLHMKIGFQVKSMSAHFLRFYTCMDWGIAYGLYYIY